MTDRCGDKTAKRVFVSVSKTNSHWSRAWAYEKEIVKVAIDLINSNNITAQIADTDTILVVKERWPMKIWIVFDIFNTAYDPAEAHLPGRNDLPVIAVSLSKNTSLTIASKLVKDRVNQGVRDAHDLHGFGSQAPFEIDHADNNIPTFPSPRIQTTRTSKEEERKLH